MGFRYRATVVLPARAKEIPEIAEWFDSEAQHYEIDELGDGLISVSHDDANYGRIDITELLEQHRISYDHEHTDGESDEDRGWMYVRFSNGADAVADKMLGKPGKTETWISYAEEVISDEAKYWRELLDAGKYGELRESLTRTIKEVEPLE